MSLMTNKMVNVHLDKIAGTLRITGLMIDTVVYLYDAKGDLQYKQLYQSPCLDLKFSKKGTYVLVMSHPNCQPEVKRIVY